MAEPHAEISRRAAARLAPEIDPKLPQMTERVLSVGDSGVEQYELGTAIAVASLLVSMVGVAWQVYQDLKKKTQRPSRDVFVRRMRVQTRERTELDGSKRDRMVEVVVDEVMAAARGDS